MDKNILSIINDSGCSVVTSAEIVLTCPYTVADAAWLKGVVTEERLRELQAGMPPTQRETEMWTKARAFKRLSDSQADCAYVIRQGTSKQSRGFEIIISDREGVIRRQIVNVPSLPDALFMLRELGEFVGQACWHADSDRFGTDACEYESIMDETLGCENGLCDEQLVSGCEGHDPIRPSATRHKNVAHDDAESVRDA